MPKNQIITLLKIGLAVAAAMWLPVRIVFFGDSIWVDLLCDFVFAVLILAPYVAKKFDTGSEEADSETHRFQLWSDILIGLPLVTILDPLIGPLAKYFFLPKLLILKRLADTRSLLENQDAVHPVIARLMPLFFIMPTVVHLLACGWVFLGSGTAGPIDDKVLEYAKAVYWAFTTLSTVGYGDISAKTVPQMAFASMTMVIGVAFFGYVLSNVASILARMDAAREAHLSAVDRVESFMRYNNLPSQLRLKVRAYYRYLWDSHRGYNDASILSDLPQKLRSEVSLNLNAEMIEKVPLLSGAAPETLQDIVLQLLVMIAVPGEKIFHIGEPGDAMYFIHRGTVEILTRDGAVVATLHPGSFFGEMALLTSNPRMASARAISYCDLFVLKREAFEKVLARYPQFDQQVREIAQKRMVA